jgi:hypothetical protein
MTHGNNRRAPYLPFGVQRNLAALPSAATRVTAPERALWALRV